MRISGIQNFITNNINKVNQNSNNSVNNSAKNNFERSPMQDTVSFGKYDERYKEFLIECMTAKLLSIGQLGIEDPLMDCKYLKLVPTKDCLLDPEKAKCALEFNVAYLKEVQPFASEKAVNVYLSRMKQHLNKFNSIHKYQEGWEKELEQPEDFVRAIEFAEYLNNRPYFSGDRETEIPDRPYHIPGVFL